LVLDALLPELAAGRGCTQPAQFHVFDVFEHNLWTLEAMDAMLAPVSRPAAALADVDAPGARSIDGSRTCGGPQEDLTPGVTRGVLLKIAALLHDVGKPETQRRRGRPHPVPGSRRHWRPICREHHAEVAVCDREIALVKLLVAEHLRPVQLAPVGAVPTRRALYRFHRDAWRRAAVGVAARARGRREARGDRSRKTAGQDRRRI
jgi:poly(A) polymerase